MLQPKVQKSDDVDFEQRLDPRLGSLGRELGAQERLEGLCPQKLLTYPGEEGKQRRDLYFCKVEKRRGTFPGLRKPNCFSIDGVRCQL